MTTLTGKFRFGFEPKMAVDLSATGATATPESLAVTLGTLSALSYKPSRFAYNLNIDAAASSAVVTISLKASGAVLWQTSHNLNGLIEVGQSVAIDLSQVAGETPLVAEVEVTTAEASRTATLDAFLDVEQPLMITGC